MKESARPLLTLPQIALMLFCAGFTLLSCGDDDDDKTDPVGNAGSVSIGSGGSSSGGSSSSTGGGSTGGSTSSSTGGASAAGSPGTGGAVGGSTSAGGSGTGTGGGSYLPCTSAKDCEAFGGGKVCCDAGSMKFCTKPSACPGHELP